MRLPAKKVHKILELCRDPVSLETPIGEDNNSFFEEFIQDTAVPSPLDTIYHRELQTKIKKLLAGLDDKERGIITARYGIERDSPCTLEEIGSMHNVTRERIRQLEQKTLKKLRHPALSGQLRDLL